MRTDLFIDGKWRKGGHGTVLEVENPATEEVLTRVEQASINDAHQAISAARRAFDEGPWPRLPDAERRAMMTAFVDAVVARSDRLAELLVAEAGSTVQLARTGQVGVPLSTCAIWSTG
jgi:acyl-CoA reductase-like NAD-dependent aldehyde dehydrogenase